jgi:hypothetical protein
MLIGLGVLALDVALFAAVGWWFMRKEEDKLNDGDPRNPYARRNQRRWWR